MDFGVRIAEGREDFGQTIQQAQLAEEFGFGTVYVAEHHGFPEGAYWPSPLLTLSAVASRTSEINLGTNIAVLPLYNPVRLAGEIALLDVISNGRTKFGFGIGWRPIEFEALGVPRSERGKRMDEYLQILDELLTSDVVSFDGDFFQFEDFELTPKPVQRPRPDLYVGGWSEQTIRRATEATDGWVAPSGTYDRIEKFVNNLRERGDPRVIIGTRGTVVRESGENVREATKEFLTGRMKPLVRAGRTNHYEEFIKHTDREEDQLVGETEREVETIASEIAEFRLRDGVDEYVSNNCFIAGTPSACIEQLEYIIERTSCDEIVFRPSTNEFEVAKSSRTIELLGEEVLPSF